MRQPAWDAYVAATSADVAATSVLEKTILTIKTQIAADATSDAQAIVDALTADAVVTAPVNAFGSGVPSAPVNLSIG
ncbi:MAG: hypothetical protein U0414_22400 [Polyangiaceae bacterium]